MEQAQYKNNVELKFLARKQMYGRFGILMGTMFIPFLISFFSLEIVTTPSYIVTLILQFIARVILSVLDVGATLVYMKCACNMPTKISELFYGYRHNTAVALKIGALFVLIDTICMIPGDLVSLSILNTVDLTMPEINEMTTMNEVATFYNNFYSVMGKYYAIMLLCILVAFLVKLAFVPAYYMMLDFPNRNASTILKKSVEVMRGNKLRYVLLQLTFLPAMILSVFTCGLTLIWLVPYMHLTNANFYLDIMSVKNKSMNNSSY